MRLCDVIKLMIDDEYIVIDEKTCDEIYCMIANFMIDCMWWNYCMMWFLLLMIKLMTRFMLDDKVHGMIYWVMIWFFMVDDKTCDEIDLLYGAW